MTESTHWLPEPNEHNRPFFEGACLGELRIQSCIGCRGWMYPAKKRCQHCGSKALTWQAVSGSGILYSHARLQRVYHPRHEGRLPVILALIDLEEGVRVSSNLVNCQPSDATVGMAVHVVFEELPHGVFIPVFQPA